MVYYKDAGANEGPRQVKTTQTEPKSDEEPLETTCKMDEKKKEKKGKKRRGVKYL